MNSRAIAQRSIARQDTKPQDTSLLWLDTNFDPASLKQYNASTSEWEPVASSAVTVQDTAPTSPSDGDVWVDTSLTPPVAKLYDSGAGEWNAQGSADAYNRISGSGDLLTVEPPQGIFHHVKLHSNHDLNYAGRAYVRLTFKNGSIASKKILDKSDIGVYNRTAEFWIFDDLTTQTGQVEKIEVYTEGSGIKECAAYVAAK